MSEVEGRITLRVAEAFGALAEAVRSAQEALQAPYELAPAEPVKAEQPGRFEHTDYDGDSAIVEEHYRPMWLCMTVNEKVCHLSPDAVNRLAQYLDQHRTDQQDCDVDVSEGDGTPLCFGCGHTSHVGIPRCGVRIALSPGRGGGRGWCRCEEGS